jgi:hypothetical protein
MTNDKNSNKGYESDGSVESKNSSRTEGTARTAATGVSENHSDNVPPEESGSEGGEVPEQEVLVTDKDNQRDIEAHYSSQLTVGNVPCTWVWSAGHEIRDGFMKDLAEIRRMGEQVGKSVSRVSPYSGRKQEPLLLAIKGQPRLYELCFQVFRFRDHIREEHGKHVLVAYEIPKEGGSDDGGLVTVVLEPLTKDEASKLQIHYDGDEAHKDEIFSDDE